MKTYCKFVGVPPNQYYLIAEFVAYICNAEKVDVAINFDHKKKEGVKLGGGDCFCHLNGHYSGAIHYDFEQAQKNEWSNSLKTIARERTTNFRKTELFKKFPHIAKAMLMLYDLLHEVGHIKLHRGKKKGIMKDKIDHKKYTKNLSYRMEIEKEADKWAMDMIEKYSFFGFLDTIV